MARTGSPLNTGYTVDAPMPIDSRTLATTFSELDSIAIKYNHLIVHVIDENADYLYIKATNTWEKRDYGGAVVWGNITGDILEQIDLQNQFSNYSLTTHTHPQLPPEAHTHDPADINDDGTGYIQWETRKHVASNFILNGSQESEEGGYIISWIASNGTLDSEIPTGSKVTFQDFEFDKDTNTFSYEETDPTVPVWVKEITEQDISNWNYAFNNPGGAVPTRTSDLINDGDNFYDQKPFINLTHLTALNTTYDNTVSGIPPENVQDAIDYIMEEGVGGGGSLTEEVTSNLSVGGISSNTTYPINTEFTQMWKELLVTKGINSLSYEVAPGSVSGTVVEVGVSIFIRKFTYSITGTVQNMFIQDNVGQFGETVTGIEHPVPDIEYVRTSPGSIVWTITGDDVSSKKRTTNWYYPSYSGVMDTDNHPTEGEVLATGIKQVANVSGQITATIGTDDTQWGYILVHNSITNYTQWIIDPANNFGNIGATGLISQEGTLDINGQTYKLYFFNYKTRVATLILT